MTMYVYIYSDISIEIKYEWCMQEEREPDENLNWILSNIII